MIERGFWERLTRKTQPFQGRSKSSTRICDDSAAAWTSMLHHREKTSDHHSSICNPNDRQNTTLVMKTVEELCGRGRGGGRT
jgi:hypothetical protein